MFCTQTIANTQERKTDNGSILKAVFCMLVFAQLIRLRHSEVTMFWNPKMLAIICLNNSNQHMLAIWLVYLIAIKKKVMQVVWLALASSMLNM